MHEEYLPKTFETKLSRMTEECAEVIIEIQKIGRFGLDSYHPDDVNQISNKDRLLEELYDLKHAIGVIEDELKRGSQSS